ncbi:MAG TPA: S41 family peptidase [Symbiobacteriaceae bacterium]|nr:S41 family peptidase [Symbiobacteriaceae bacterium]
MKPWFARVALVCCLGLLLPRPVAAAEPTPPPLEQSLVEAYQTILYEHYNLIDEDQLLQAAIKGMIDSLGDPYASAMSAAEFEAFKNALDADYGGVGVLLTPADGTLEITQLFPGAPALAAGLQVGDRILAVDGQPITQENAQKAPSQIIGPVGTSVTLLIQRGTAAPAAYRIQRAKIDLPSAEGRDLGAGLGYIQIRSMGETTTAEFLKALSDLHQPQGIVLDLRGNGGGTVLSAVEIADHLLAHGTILSIRDGSGEQQSIEADEAADPVPLVVLVDAHTASAAEILAGALQKNHRALVLGTRTFGKGTMQQSFPLANGGVLKLTTDHWFLPDGTSLQKVGLQPDLVVTTQAVQLQAAVHLLDSQRAIETAIPTVERKGVTYLPLRFALEALAVQVNWSAATGMVTATYGKQSVLVNPTMGTMQIGGAPVGGEAPILLDGGTTYISAAAFAQLTGLELQARDTQSFLRRQ